MAATVSSRRNPADRNADATVHIAQLDDKVTDALLWQLMIQAAPVRHIYIPRNRITGAHYGYGFCEFYNPLDAHYATKVFNLVHLYAKPIRISQSTIDRRSYDVGANLFIGNLVEEVDEKLLYDAFSSFGQILDTPYIMRDPVTNESKRYGFVKYSSFDHSDAAIAAMNGQYICNAPISVQYAFKKDSDNRERHGSQAERILAQKGAETNLKASLESQLRPHTLFSDRPASAPPHQRRAPVLVPPPDGYGVNPSGGYYPPAAPAFPPPGVGPRHWQGTAPHASGPAASAYPYPPPRHRSPYPHYNRAPPMPGQPGWFQRQTNNLPDGNRSGIPPNSGPTPVMDERAPPAPKR